MSEEAEPEQKTEETQVEENVEVNAEEVHKSEEITEEQQPEQSAEEESKVEGGDEIGFQEKPPQEGEEESTEEVKEAREPGEAEEEEYVKGEEKVSDETKPTKEHEKPEVEVEKDPFESMTDEDLIKACRDLETTNRYLMLENQIFQEFLQNYNPDVLEGLEQMVSYATTIALKQAEGSLSEVPKDLKSEVSERSIESVESLKKTRVESMPSINNLLEGRGPKINISTKTDMIIKTMEEAQANHDAFIKKSLKFKRNLKSELEEFAIRESDISTARNQFEYNVVVNGVDILTGKVPAEKWIRYMEDWLKTAGLAMEKLRLRTASLRHQYKKLSSAYVQRKELGANVHAVDFDQLEIANKHLLAKIDQKQVHLVELKKMNGGANLVLSRHKKYLLQQQIDFNKLKEASAEKEKQIKELEDEFTKVEQEKDAAREKFEKFKEFKNTYRVPEVMEYVVLKKELDELRKNIKIWQRRKSIQDISLNASIREIKHLTGCSTLDPAWIEDPVVETDDDFELIM